MVNINKYIKALLHPAGGHQGSHKAHQAGNQSRIKIWSIIKFSYLFWTMSQWYLHFTSHSFVMFVQTTRTDTGLTTATAPGGHQMALVVSRTVY